MPKQPIAEAFGFPIDNTTEEAARHWKLRLCPFNNKVPNCTKDKAQDPLGVCSVLDGEELAITCPIRFRENWLIAEDAAGFFFPEGIKWTSLAEVRLQDEEGKSAGNIDLVLVSYDERGRVLDFGALEVQAVYISGNIRKAFDQFMINPEVYKAQNYMGANYPRPDYLSSSRKRLAPQMIYKGGILHVWKKKIGVALHTSFFDTLPLLSEVPKAEAEVAWFLYDLKLDRAINRYTLVRNRTVFTKFEEALLKITRTEAGPLEVFVAHLQEKLDEKLGESAPITPTLGEILEQ